ncbi:dienelactone hydrolase family protein [Tricladium varicosporioides]|nr:dienelactone hydrolase family protein [Hymenoscyphus varicosporioides]
MSISDCCLKGFTWNGTPIGRVSKLANNDAYVAGDNPNRAILLIHDLFGWTFPNIRLLADHYAAETSSTVYVPDFFGGEVPPSLIVQDPSTWLSLGFDVYSFIAKHSRAIREPEIFACARELKGKYKKVGAVGFCYGGWACLRLASSEHSPPLVDAISIGHPSMMVEADFDNVSVPIQVLAPEKDLAFTRELKAYAFEKLALDGKVKCEWRHFPGVEHACFVRGSEENEGERNALVRGKEAVVQWMVENLEVEK